METREMLFGEMSEKIGSLAAEIICRATGTQRHWARVEATVEAARVWGNAHIYSDEESDILVAGILSLELGGVGGRADAEGAGTDRHPAFAGLGKGRKQASDGGAYMAATEAALRQLTDRHGRLHIQLDQRGRVVVKFRGSEAEVLLQCCGPVRWLRAEASRAALKAAGIEGFEPQMKWELEEAIERALYECVQAEKDLQWDQWRQSAQQHAPAEWEAYANAPDDADSKELATLNKKMVSLGFGYMPEQGEWPS